MDDETRRLFDRISQRLGWDKSADLRGEEQRLKESIKKSKKKPLLSLSQPVLDPEDLNSPFFESCSHRLDLSGSDSDSAGSLKENKSSTTTRQRCQKVSAGFASQPGAVSRSRWILESSNEDPGQTGGRKGKKGLIEKTQERVPALISDSSDDDFEMFLSQLKTPKTCHTEPKNLMEGFRDFIADSDDDFVFDLPRKGKGTSCKKGLKNSRSQEVPAAPAPGKSHTSSKGWMTPVFVNDSEDEDSSIVKSTLRDRRKAKTRHLKNDGRIRPASVDSQAAPAGPRQNPSKTLNMKERAVKPKPPLQRAVSWESRPQASQGSESSEDEFESLMERLKNRTRTMTPSSTANRNVEQRLTGGEPGHLKPLRDTVNETGKAEKGLRLKPKFSPQEDIASSPLLPTWSPPPIRGISDMVPPASQKRSAPCCVPNCFLQDLTKPASPYVKNFKQKKHELTQRLYSHFNSTIFDLQLPENLEIIWNKKMRKTAGYCVTGQTRGLEMQRYARIELSDKVCDSADRLRDTLIHEICHAATWLLNAVRDGHGQFWRCYAKKATVIHPELPMVTRCHTYEINYKFTYQCSRCNTTIGRHSKSLDTQRFVCALCQGQLVLLQSVRKDGTPSNTKLTPFAKFVKENYSVTKKGTGISHVEVMRKLSADFATKTQIAAS